MGSFTIKSVGRLDFWDFYPPPPSSEDVRSETLPKWKYPAVFENLKTSLDSASFGFQNVGYPPPFVSRLPPPALGKSLPGSTACNRTRGPLKPWWNSHLRVPRSTNTNRFPSCGVDVDENMKLA